MEFKDFIKQSLISITTAVSESREEIESLGGILNPKSVDSKKTRSVYREEGNVERLLQDIDFDIAVTVTKSAKGDGEVSVNLSFLTIAGGGGGDSTNETVSRIKFSVPLVLPCSEKEGTRTKITGGLLS